MFIHVACLACADKLHQITQTRSELLSVTALQGFSMTTPESEYKRVVRHETGHTLGFPHEHLRQEIVNDIDPDKAITYFR